MIEVRNLTKRYGTFTAVNDLSLTVNNGEIMAFLGVNGAGKTTTLRMLAGVLKPTSGEIFLDGFSVEREPLKAKAILGYIPDRPYLYSKLTGVEYLTFVAELHNMDGAEAKERIRLLLLEYGLVEWQDELIEGYSHGMKQRLATCGALLPSPRVFVVDEPMVGLDPHGAKLLKESLRRYARLGMSILLSTHSLNVAEEVADRIAIIDHGALIGIGTLDEIKAMAGGKDKNLEEIFLQLTSSIYEIGAGDVSSSPS